MRLFPQMDLTVSVEQAFRFEALATCVTGIWPFVAVRPHVHIEEILFIKPCITYFASVCLFAGVAQRVIPQ